MTRRSVSNNMEQEEAESGISGNLQELDSQSLAGVLQKLAETGDDNSISSLGLESFKGTEKECVREWISFSKSGKLVLIIGTVVQLVI